MSEVGKWRGLAISDSIVFQLKTRGESILDVAIRLVPSRV